MGGAHDLWHGTTQDWAGAIDLEHLAGIRQDPAVYAPGGVLHLILEVIAYAADEAECTGTGRCEVTMNADGSVSVSDHGRGTDTRFDDEGRPVKKPVMSTRDRRFFDLPDAQPLPDGHPRRGMSVVSALSEWLVHTNRRASGSWTQRYERGIAVTDLVPIADDGTTGTSMQFLPDPGLPTAGWSVSEVIRLAASWPHLAVLVRKGLARPTVARCPG